MKKHVKRTLSFLLALTMVLSLGLPAYAVSPANEETVPVISDMEITERPGIDNEVPSVQPEDELVGDFTEPVEEPVEEPAEDPAEEPAEDSDTEAAELPDLSSRFGDVVLEGKITETGTASAEEEELTEKGPRYPAQDFAYSEEETGFTVEVSAPAGALPEGTEMRVTRLADLADVQAAVDKAENLEGAVQLAADISFWLEDEEIEPAEGSKLLVRMSAPEIEGIAAPIVIHIPDGDNSVPEIVDQIIDMDEDAALNTVSFQAADFSVYAVIGDGETGKEARLAVNFRMPDNGGEDGKGTIITTVYIKNGDMYAGTNEKQEGKTYIDDIVYDPGLPEEYDLGKKLFRGWTIDEAAANPQPTATEENPNPAPIPYGKSYNKDTKVYTVETITAYLAGKLNSIKEGDELNIYAMIFETYTISYYGKSTDVTMGQHLAYIPVNDEGGAPYTINMKYVPEDNHEFFEGWKILNGKDNISYAIDPDGHEITGRIPISEEAPNADPPVTATLFPNGSELVITGDVEFTVSAPKGNWLIFKENGKGATYNAPQFVKSGETTVLPANATSDRMIRKGYDFLGWYEVETDIVNGRAVPRTDPATGDYVYKSTEYVFGQQLTQETIIAAKWAAVSDAPYTVVLWKQNLDGDGYDFWKSIPLVGTTGAEITGIAQTGAGVTDVDDTGASRTTKNMVVTGTKPDNTAFSEEIKELGFHTGHYDGQPTEDHPEGTPITIAAEGNTVVNIYYDRNIVQLNFWLYYQNYFTNLSELDTSNNTYQNTKLYFVNNYTTYWVWYLNGRWVYGRGNNSYQTLTQDTIDKYGLQIYVDGESASWHKAATIQGLYQSSLSANGYRWPSTIGNSSYRWQESYSGSSPDGMTIVLLDAFDTQSDKMVANYYGASFTSYYTIHFMTENANGSGYTESGTAESTGGTFYLSNKFTGYHCTHYHVGSNGTVNYVTEAQYVKDSDGQYYYDVDTTTDGVQGVPYSDDLYIYFDRLAYKISYQDGIYVDGNNNVMKDVVPLGFIGETEEITFGDDISSYGQRYQEDGVTPNPKYLIPTPNDSGYVFEGWYADETCTTLYDFDTMPLNGVTVFAKWRLTQYRVFLRTNVPTDDPSLDWGSDDQSMNFRINRGDYVSTPTGRRTGYVFVGWYYDEDFDDVFDAELVPLTDDNVTADYDKTATENMTDNQQTWVNPKTNKEENKPINKYGVLEPGDSGVNKDVNRFWITKKLDLYAKWKAILENADGIGVVYDEVPVGEDGVKIGHGVSGSAPTDGGRLYEDNSKAIAQPASTAADESEQFLYWVVQKWNKDNEIWEDLVKDGEKVKVYPGDNFTVLAENAQITPDPDNPDKNFYVVHLRAEYGAKDGPEPTHITWYSNIYDVAGNVMPDVKNKMQHPDEVEGATVTFDSANGYKIDFEGVKINEKQNIPAFDTYSYEGYVFLGWARIETTDAASPDGAGLETRAAGKTPSELTEDDLFLKWDADNEQYLCKNPNAKGENDTWIPAKGVAADEFTPYHDLYAVWSGEFYVVHTGKDNATADNVKETYQISRANNEFDLLWNANRDGEKTSTITPGFLYGGYYLEATAPNDGAAYNGSNWTFSDAQTFRADKIHPVGGQTYYIKEVPDVYLRGVVRYTYFLDAAETVGSLYLVCGVDEEYDEFGVVLGDGTTFKGEFADSLVLTPENKPENYATYNIANLVTKYGEQYTGGKVAYVELMNISEDPVDGQHGDRGFLQLLAENGDTANVYWVTKDGFYVNGIWSRAYSNLYAGVTAPSTPVSSIPVYPEP